MKLSTTRFVAALLAATSLVSARAQGEDPIIPLPEDPLAQTIAIDIKPGSSVNPINMKSKGVTPVAVLTDESFDAATLDVTTLLFGATGVEAAAERAKLADVDNDGDLDLICHFRTRATGLTDTDTEAVLTATALDGTLLVGSDVVRVKMPKVKPPKPPKPPKP